MLPDSLKQNPLIQELVARKIRLTGQRKTLMQTIQETGGHLDAATLLKLARERDPQIDRATVYRTLDLLKRLRLVDELDLMHLNGEKHFYEAKTRGEHIHLACIECGRIKEFTSPALERLKREIARECDFEIRVTRLEIGGRCAECRNGIRDTKNGGGATPGAMGHN